MDIELFTICDYAQDMGGKLVIVGTFDTIFAPNLPIQVATCHVAARIRFRASDAGKIPFEARITAPDGKDVIPPMKGTMNIQVLPGAESAAHHLCLGIGGLPFNTYGRHSLTLSVRGQELRSLPIYVSHPPQQAVQQAQLPLS
jgi:hypothetical protein